MRIFPSFFCEDVELLIVYLYRQILIRKISLGPELELHYQPNSWHTLLDCKRTSKHY